MELLKSSIFADCSPAFRSLGEPGLIRTANPDRSPALRPAISHSSWWTRPLVRNTRWSRGSREGESVCSQTADKQKRGPFRDRAPICPGRRPTDLCATALFSFQGTDASARPVSDRITDRTKGARRQSQREIDYHRVSTMSTTAGAVLSTALSTWPASGSRSLGVRGLRLLP